MERFACLRRTVPGCFVFLGFSGIRIDMKPITVLLNHKNVERLRGDRGAFNNKVCLGLTGRKITDVRRGWVDKIKTSGVRMDLDDFNRLLEVRNDKWTKEDEKELRQEVTQQSLL